MTLAELPNDARLWIFAAARRLDASELNTLLTVMDRHIQNWRAHGARVVGAGELRYDQFLLIGADERATGVSGCSIDSLFRVLQAVEAELGVRLLDSGRIWFRDNEGEIRCVSRPEFRVLARSGKVGPDTTVFNNSVVCVGEVRAGRWETPLRDSWHARAFGVSAETAPAEAAR